jgi:hypothetical protein
MRAFTLVAQGCGGVDGAMAAYGLTALFIVHWGSNVVRHWKSGVARNFDGYLPTGWDRQRNGPDLLLGEVCLFWGLPILYVAHSHSRRHHPPHSVVRGSFLDFVVFTYLPLSLSLSFSLSTPPPLSLSLFF